MTAPARPELSARGLPVSKQVFDKLVAMAGLVFFFPVFAGIAAAILLSEGRPVFFVHERIGRHGRPFRCFKFRTMAVEADRLLAELLARDPQARAEWDGNRKLTRDPRVTRLGRLLRRTSLDELPQFWNVLRGDMSMVGPRPVVAEELGNYGLHLQDYLALRPGLTGIWQVSGRSDTTFAERVQMDVNYVRTRSFLGDALIVLRTASAVLRREGAR